MKSEHRHELQTNELGKLAGHVAPYIERNGGKMIAGLIAAVAVVGGSYWFLQARGQKDSAAWTKLLTAQSAEDFAGVTEDFPNSIPGAWAQLNEASSHLQDGIRLSFTDREAATADLKLAREKLEQLVGRTDLPRELRVRALFAYARALETTSDGDLAPAIEAYGKIVSEFTDPLYSVYRENAETRKRELETGSAQEFYAWFSKQSPKPGDRPRPQDGNFHGMNLNDLELPTSLPAVPDMLKQTMTEIEKQNADSEGEGTTDGDGSSTGGTNNQPDAPPLPENSDDAKVSDPEAESDAEPKTE